MGYVYEHISVLSLHVYSHLHVRYRKKQFCMPYKTNIGKELNSANFHTIAIFKSSCHYYMAQSGIAMHTYNEIDKHPAD